MPTHTISYCAANGRFRGIRKIDHSWRNRPDTKSSPSASMIKRRWLLDRNPSRKLDGNGCCNGRQSKSGDPLPSLHLLQFPSFPPDDCHQSSVIGWAHPDNFSMPACVLAKDNQSFGCRDSKFRWAFIFRLLRFPKYCLWIVGRTTINPQLPTF